MGVTPATMKNPILAVVAVRCMSKKGVGMQGDVLASTKTKGHVIRMKVRPGAPLPQTEQSMLTTRQLLGVADAYALAAGRIVDVRLARRAEMTDPEARTLERSEDRLGKTIALLRVSELRFTNASGEHIARLITDTVDAAVRALSRGSIPRVVALAQSLADFAGTALTRDATQVELAAQQLRALVRRHSRSE